MTSAKLYRILEHDGWPEHHPLVYRAHDHRVGMSGDDPASLAEILGVPESEVDSALESLEEAPTAEAYYCSGLSPDGEVFVDGWVVREPGKRKAWWRVDDHWNGSYDDGTTTKEPVRYIKDSIVSAADVYLTYGPEDEWDFTLSFTFRS